MFCSSLIAAESWGITEGGLLKRYGEAMSSTLGPVDFAGVAQGLGALGAQVSSKAELVEMVRQGLGEQVPMVVHAPIVGGLPGD